MVLLLRSQTNAKLTTNVHFNLNTTLSTHNHTSGTTISGRYLPWGTLRAGTGGWYTLTRMGSHPLCTQSSSYGSNSPHHIRCQLTEEEDQKATVISIYL